MTSRFIVIEGPDGSGKSTHLKLLSERLRGLGHTVVERSEPDDNAPIGKFIREVLKGEMKLSALPIQLLFTADRADGVARTLVPHLKDGKTVITDRYWYSTIAHGAAYGVDIDWLVDANKRFPKPDLVLFALPPLELCMERLGIRSTTDMFEKHDVQEKVHAAYRHMAEQDPSIIVIDTSGKKEETAETVWNIVKDKLSL